MSTLQHKIDTKMADLKHLREVHSEAQRKFFKSIIHDYFDEYPKIARIRWTQYTPYFNDGEACEFDINEIHLETEKDVQDGSGSAWDNGTEAYEFLKATSPDGHYWNSPALQAAQGIVRALEDDAKEIFGDHVEVFVTRTEVTTSEYSHD